MSEHFNRFVEESFVNWRQVAEVVGVAKCRMILADLLVKMYAKLRCYS
jgi:hypothetical protein